MKYKVLFRKLDRNLGTVALGENLRTALGTILEKLVDDFEEDLGLAGGRLYARSGDDFVLVKEYPESGQRQGFRIPVDYQPVHDLLRDGFVYHELGDPELDRRIEDALGVSSFAAIRVGEPETYLMAFSLKQRSEPDDVIYMLNTVRHVIDLKLRKQRLEDRVAQLRAIQISLLLRTVPRFPGFDVWGATAPAEEVGGDLYDFMLLSERSLAVVVADSAGHGLPAALQARDAIIGLRMGVEEQLRITATVEKLNRVVNHSALSSKFISLFYCELEPSGQIVYCNAGHNPPLLWNRSEFTELTRGGTVLGPVADARYERGYAQLTDGAILLLYTDGIVESRSHTGDEMYGTERLKDLIRSRPWSSARSLVEAVFAQVREFSHADPPADDQTVVAVIRGRGEDSGRSGDSASRPAPAP